MAAHIALTVHIVCKDDSKYTSFSKVFSTSLKPSLTMIRSGKTSDPPWLKLSDDEYHAWATFNGIGFSGCEVAFHASLTDPSGNDARKGGGLVCQSEQGESIPSPPAPFIKVSPEMVLSEARVIEMARGDSKLAELLRSCGSLLAVSLVFMLTKNMSKSRRQTHVNTSMWTSMF